MNGANAGGIVACAQVVQVIAVHRGQHHVFQPHQRHGIGHVGRLLGIKPAVWVAGIDGAELACPRADRAHQHQRGRAASPAFGDVGAFGFSAHRVQFVRAHNVHHRFVFGPIGHTDAQPIGLFLGIGNGGQGVGLHAIEHRLGAFRGDDFGARSGPLAVDGNSLFAHAKKALGCWAAVNIVNRANCIDPACGLAGGRLIPATSAWDGSARRADKADGCTRVYARKAKNWDGFCFLESFDKFVIQRRRQL